MTTKSNALPKTLGACADKIGAIDLRLDEIAQALKKLALTKEATYLSGLRKALEEHLINELPASDADGICGRVTRATINVKRIPVLKDWTKFTKYVQRKGAFELMQHRISVEAVNERWAAKQEIPGVEGFTVKKLSITKK